MREIWDVADVVEAGQILLMSSDKQSLMVLMASIDVPDIQARQKKE